VFLCFRWDLPFWVFLGCLGFLVQFWCFADFRDVWVDMVRILGCFLVYNRLFLRDLGCFVRCLWGTRDFWCFCVLGGILSFEGVLFVCVCLFVYCVLADWFVCVLSWIVCLLTILCCLRVCVGCYIVWCSVIAFWCYVCICYFVVLFVFIAW